MSKPRLLETVAMGMRRQGLPAADIARLLEELNDHVTDILMEQGGPMHKSTELNEKIESRLGRPELLVAAAVANRRHASFFGRHPVWTFVVAPIPVTILCLAAMLFLCVGLAECAGWLLGDQYDIEGKTVADWPPALFYVVDALMIVMRFLPPVVVALLLCWCARRAGMNWIWTVSACGLVAFAAWTIVVQLKLPEYPGEGSLTLGLGLPIFQWTNLVQLLVPLAIGLAFLWGGRKRARAL